MAAILKFIRKLTPKFIANIYHYKLALLAAVFYGFPSRKLTVIGVTGTKGKSSTVYFLSKVLEGAGYKTAVLSSIQSKIGDKEWPNKLKMTMPGRFQIQKFLSEAVTAGCKFAVIEVSSQGVVQSRHRFINFDSAVFTNLAPEHIESHGSFEKYKEAKLRFFRYVKNNHILNKGDKYFDDFWNVPAKNKIVYSFADAQDLKLQIAGEFNLSNGAAATKTAEIYGINKNTAKNILENIKFVPGRMEFIEEGQDFKVVVDYAHTPDSLSKVYETLRNGYKLTANSYKLVCVLGAAGGGRDKWKRPEFGKIAAEFCEEVILTNEDPYDENPEEILNQISSGFSQIRNPIRQPTDEIRKIIDRGEAIKKALNLAKKGDIVVITGKGCEQWMMLSDGKKIPWDDRKIVREELKKIAH